MASTRACLWLLFMIIKQIIGEDTGSVIMSLISDSKFQCANTTCLPFINVITSNIRNCQVACLTQSQCRAATFHRSTSNCELFGDMLNQNGNMLTDVDTTSMNVISGTRFPSGQAVVFCNPTQAGSIVSPDNHLRIIITIDERLKTKCKTAYCFTQCVTEIKTDIQSKFESTSFTIVTNLGSHIVSSQFYAFVQVLSGEFKISLTF
ncbi:unnamed protein product [Adineta steineri]|uniref:Apple domain-containing protein n=1 Tax=Adineta steineri TaxID=433720 RepID=A0A815DTJ0_9BILA|nr:unnamed protein product [Adineta steineri]